ncbi:YusU family protein [Paenibacillus sp. P25]|nr:YusU family protein [Paenibacillus sp. P25]
MDSQFQSEFGALVEKFAEPLTGDTSPETMEKIKIWSIYNHIHKTMPALASHWNQNHPESKAEIRKLFEEVRDLNQKLKAEHNGKSAE